MMPADGPVEYLIASSAETRTALEPFGGLDTVLSPDEMSAARRFRKAADRADYRAGHAIFRLLAARWLGTGHREAAELPVTRYCRSHGDPGLARPPMGTPWQTTVVCHSIPEINGIGIASIGAPHGYVAALASVRTPSVPWCL